MTEQISLPQIIIWCNRSENCLGVSADLFIIIVIWWVLPDVLWFLLIRKLWHPFGKLGLVSKGFSLLWSLCFMWTWDHALSPALILWYQIPWSVWSSLQSSMMFDSCWILASFLESQSFWRKGSRSIWHSFTPLGGWWGFSPTKGGRRIGYLSITGISRSWTREN